MENDMVRIHNLEQKNLQVFFGNSWIYILVIRF